MGGGNVQSLPPQPEKKKKKATHSEACKLALPGNCPTCGPLAGVGAGKTETSKEVLALRAQLAKVQSAHDKLKNATIVSQTKFPQPSVSAKIVAQTKSSQPPGARLAIQWPASSSPSQAQKALNQQKNHQDFEIKKPIFRGAEALRKQVLESLRHKIRPNYNIVRVDKFSNPPRYSLREILTKPHLKPQMALLVGGDKAVALPLGRTFDKVTGYNSLSEKVANFGKERGLRANPSRFKMGMTKSKMVDQLIDNELNDEIEKNRIAYMYLAALLLPEEFENIGIPDQYNSSRSGKPTVVTEYVVPFDSNGQVAAIISDDPLEHIRILGGGTTQAINGPTFRNTGSTNGQTGFWQVVQNPLEDYVATPSYLVSGQTSTFSASDGLNSLVNPWNIQGSTESYNLTTVTVETSSGTKDYLMAPAKPNDTFYIEAQTPDTTSSGYSLNVQVIKYINGAYLTDIQTQSVTGSGTRITNTFTLDADVVGIYGWYVSNLLAGTDTFASAQVSCLLTLGAGDIILPVGKATGEDVAFLVDYADEYRSGPCSVKTTYFGGYLENGLLLQGQLPNDNDFEIPPPNVTDWSLIPGITTKALNDASAPGAYCPMIRKDYTTSTWQSLQNPTDQPAHERVAVLIRANGVEAEYAKFRTIWQGQYRTMNQMPYTSDGLSNDDAIDLVMTWLMEMTNGGVDLVFGNDDHESCCDKILREFEKERGGTTYSFFNGWFSGNQTSVKDVVV